MINRFSLLMQYDDCLWCMVIGQLLQLAVAEHIAVGVGSVGSIPLQVKSDTVSPTACHRCDVSSELCCSSANAERRK